MTYSIFRSLRGKRSRTRRTKFGPREGAYGAITPLEKRDSNPRLLRYRWNALPTELSKRGRVWVRPYRLSADTVGHLLSCNSYAWAEYFVNWTYMAENTHSHVALIAKLVEQNPGKGTLWSWNPKHFLAKHNPGGTIETWQRNMLCAFGHRVATCWVLWAQVWKWSNLSQQHPTCCNRVAKRGWVTSRGHVN